MEIDEELRSVTGVVEDIIFFNEENGYIVLDLDADGELVTAVGCMGDVREGERLTLYGDYINSPKYGRQFRADIFERTMPEDVNSVRKYLGSGVISGVGPAMAKRIVAAFGDKTLKVIEEDPAQLSAIKGISPERAKAIGDEFKSITGLRKAMTYFSKYKVPPRCIAAAWKQYEVDTVRAVMDNPYCLCESGIDLPFNEADRIAADLGYPRDGEERVIAGLIHVLKAGANDGNTCLRESDLCENVTRMLSISDRLYWSALEIAESRCMVVNTDKYDERRVFLTEYYDAEMYIAEKIAEMLKYPPADEVDHSAEIAGIAWEQGIEYEKSQIEAINGCMNNRLFILTGGPGTGKTTTLNAVIRLCEQRGQKIKLAAPTGRAAKRMAELTGAQAQTIHRLLEVDFAVGGSAFRRNEGNPLACDAVIIDEASMVDALLMRSLLKALKNKTRLILVGDANQLPSVGAGNVLRDLLATGLVPSVELTEIFRQAAESLIVTNAHRIIHGEMPLLNDRKRDFFFMRSDSEENTLRLVLELCATRLPRTYSLDPVDDIQVLCLSRLGVIGTHSLNNELQLALNPPARDKREIKVFDTLFRNGDKVMQTKNDYDVEWRRGDEKSHGIFNGDIGRVRAADRLNASCEIDFDGRIAAYDSEMMKRVEHAYAVTVHKSQGSEYPAVIIPLPNGMDRLSYRNLLYTAVTRARDLLIIIGTESKVNYMVGNERRAARYSCLQTMLIDAAENAGAAV